MPQPRPRRQAEGRQGRRRSSSVAKQKCEDLKGNAKDVCKKDAKTAHTAAKDEAKAEKTAASKS